MSKRVSITNLGFDITTEDVRQYFSRFGQLSECKVMMDLNSGISRGFGFVSFTDILGVAKCLEFTAHRICDRSVKVERCNENSLTSLVLPTKKIVVSFLGVSGVSDQTVQETFSEFGTITSIEFAKKYTGESLFYCIVTFSTVESVENCIRKRHCLRGKPVFVRRVAYKEELKRAEQRERERAAREERSKAHGFAGYSSSIGATPTTSTGRLFPQMPSLLGTSNATQFQYQPQPTDVVAVASSTSASVTGRHVPLYTSRTDLYQRAYSQANFQQGYQYQENTIQTMDGISYGPQNRKKPKPSNEGSGIPGYGYM